MEMLSAKRMANMGAVAALYVVTTMLAAPLAYGQVQFRVSEMLMLLCFFNKDYVVSLTLGCFIANIFSPLGFIDAGFGTMATLIAALLIYFTRKKVNLFVASLFPVISNALIVGMELKIVEDLPFWVNAGWVALGEFVCVSVLGVTIFHRLSRNKKFMEMVSAEK